MKMEDAGVMGVRVALTIAVVTFIENMVKLKCGKQKSYEIFRYDDRVTDLFLNKISFRSNCKLDLKDGEHNGIFIKTYISPLKDENYNITCIFNTNTWEFDVVSSGQLYIHSGMGTVSPGAIVKLAHKVDMSGIDFSGCTDLGNFFSNIEIDELNIGDFVINNSNGISTAKMFSNSRIHNLVYNRFIIKNIVNAQGMFESSRIGSVVDLSGLDVTNCRSFKDMFAQAEMFKVLHLENLFNTSEKADRTEMFYAAKLKTSVLCLNELVVSHQYINKYDSMIEAAYLDTIDIKWISTDIPYQRLHIGSPSSDTMYRKPMAYDTEFKSDRRKYMLECKAEINRRLQVYGDKGAVYCIGYTPGSMYDPFDITSITVRNKVGAVKTYLMRQFIEKHNKNELTLMNPYISIIECMQSNIEAQFLNALGLIKI